MSYILEGSLWLLHRDRPRWELGCKNRGRETAEGFALEQAKGASSLDPCAARGNSGGAEKKSGPQYSFKAQLMAFADRLNVV